MKKAPRIKKALGGDVYQDDPKKKKSITGAVLTPNTNYPSPQKQLGFNEPINKPHRTFTNTGGGVDYNTPLQQTGTKIGSRNVEIIGTNLKKITNSDGSVQYEDGNGNPVQELTRAKGGEVKKITKCPKFKKGGKC